MLKLPSIVELWTTLWVSLSSWELLSPLRINIILIKINFLKIVFFYFYHDTSCSSITSKDSNAADISFNEVDFPDPKNKTNKTRYQIFVLEYLDIEPKLGKL